MQQALVDVITVTLMREGINKHRARELADHFVNFTLTPPLPVQEPVGDEWTPCMKLPVVVHVRQQRPDEAHVSTREGITPVKPDDLIMRGVSGEEYPIGRAIFEQTYSLNTTRWDSPTLQAPALAGWKAALRGKNT
jgi:hypothetical protein